ncbi:MAG: hypothetical protein KJZ96_14510 [Rhodocyclaceae bacterium]|nr:hypothetical protein [Rhodocyclaceae bacterium]
MASLKPAAQGANVVEKMLNFAFWLFDLFDRKRRFGDPLMEEKQVRERQLVLSFGCFLVFVLLYGLVEPTVWVESPKSAAEATLALRGFVSLAFAAAASLALLWSVIETIGYWRFARRVGFD